MLRGAHAAARPPPATLSGEVCKGSGRCWMCSGKRWPHCRHRRAADLTVCVWGTRGVAHLSGRLARRRQPPNTRCCLLTEGARAGLCGAQGAVPAQPHPGGQGAPQRGGAAAAARCGGAAQGARPPPPAARASSARALSELAQHSFRKGPCGLHRGRGSSANQPFSGTYGLMVVTLPSFKLLPTAALAVRLLQASGCRLTHLAGWKLAHWPCRLCQLPGGAPHC
jgi:hypothetical protein